MGYEQRGTVPLLGATIQPFNHERSSRCFLISHTSDGKDFLMYCENDQELLEWLNLLRAVASGVNVSSNGSSRAARINDRPTPPLRKQRSVTFMSSPEVVDFELRHSLTPDVGSALSTAALSDDNQEEPVIELRHSVIPKGFTPAVIRSMESQPPGITNIVKAAAYPVVARSSVEGYNEMEVARSRRKYSRTIAVSAPATTDNDIIELRHSIVPGQIKPTSVFKPQTPPKPPRALQPKPTNVQQPSFRTKLLANEVAALETAVTYSSIGDNDDEIIDLQADDSSVAAPDPSSAATPPVIIRPPPLPPPAPAPSAPVPESLLSNVVRTLHCVIDIVSRLLYYLLLVGYTDSNYPICFQSAPNPACISTSR